MSDCLVWIDAESFASSDGLSLYIRGCSNDCSVADILQICRGRYIRDRVKHPALASTNERSVEGLVLWRGSQKDLPQWHWLGEAAITAMQAGERAHGRQQFRRRSRQRLLLQM